MSEITIRTNNVPHDLLSWYELSEAEIRKLEHLFEKKEETGLQFFRYRGNIYDISEFSLVRNAPDNPFGDWAGYLADSFFSGVLIRFPKDENDEDDEDYERVIVGTYYS